MAAQDTPKRRGGWNKGQGTGHVDRRGYRWIRRADGKDIYASDQCQGHRDCGHSMEPWQRARDVIRTATSGA